MLFNLFRKSVKHVESIDPIGDHLIQTKKPEAIDAAYIQLLTQGTYAERDYAAKLQERFNYQNKLNKVLSVSQEIDLISLLRMRTKSNMPTWSLVSPQHPIKESFVRGTGTYSIPRIEIDSMYGYRLEINTGKTIPGLVYYEHALYPKSFPVLPDKVREMIRQYKYDTVFMGILYKESDWEIAEVPKAVPDPALIVQWKGIEDKYFCLAIWGGDRSEIQEFVVS